jgi:hypothetical protein
VPAKTSTTVGGWAKCAAWEARGQGACAYKHFGGARRWAQATCATELAVPMPMMQASQMTQLMMTRMHGQFSALCGRVEGAHPSFSSA